MNNSPKVFFRQKSVMSLTNPDRTSCNKKRLVRSVTGMIDYFSNEEKKAYHLVDYYVGNINKEETMNLILENGKYAKPSEIVKRKKDIVKYFENGNLYKCIISFPEDYIDEHITLAKLEQEFILKALPSFMKKIGFKDMKKMCYQCSLHMDTDNPHFHFSFIEKEPNFEYYKKIGYRRRILFEQEDINFLKNTMIHLIEKEKKYTPLLTKTNNEIDELKTYFKKGTKNYILDDKKNLLLETKILELSTLLKDKDSDYNIKFNSIRNKEVIRLTKEIKKEIFKEPELKKLKKELNDVLKDINKYFSDIALSNNLKESDYKTDLVKRKLEYIDNYILNAIVNHANKIDMDIILNEVVKKNSVPKLNKKGIIKNYLLKKKFQYKMNIETAIKNINYELEEAKKEFSKLFETNDYEK